MLTYARAGDTVVVTAIDRLGRSVAEVTHTIAQLGHRRIVLRALRDGIGTGTPTGRAVAAIMATLAELELELGRERRAASRDSRRARLVQSDGRLPLPRRPCCGLRGHLALRAPSSGHRAPTRDPRCVRVVLGEGRSLAVYIRPVVMVRTVSPPKRCAKPERRGRPARSRAHFLRL